MYIDAHTHLNSDQLYPDRHTHLSEFQGVWWTALINIWVNHQRNQRAIEITTKNPTDIFMKCAIGLHPGEVSLWHISSDTQITKEIEQLKRLYEKNSEHIVAIGECWIDAHYTWYKTVSSLQKELLFRQGCVAREYKLPLIIHSRDQFEDTFDVLQEFTDLKIYFHCRWYTPRDIITLHHTFPSLWIWFCWNTTYPKAQQLRDSILTAHQISQWTHKNTISWHSVRLLLETDAPYLSPQQKRWTQNTPSHIPYLYDAVSDYLSTPKELVCKHTETNFYALYTN